MKKLIILFLVCIILGGFIQFFLPWWSFPVLVALGALFAGARIWQGILIGFLSGLAIWIAYAYYIDVRNEQILSSKIGLLFNELSSAQLILITGILGGIIGMLGGIIGSSIAGIIRPTVLK
ncbi:MAG: hypothetical protein R2879_18925 [Saprospiraceae bacterium]